VLPAGAPGTAPKVDLLAALGLSHGDEPGRREVVRLRKDNLELEVECRGRPMIGRADRICATDDDAPAEVVKMGDVEAVLVRPDRLLPRSNGRS
jgi:ribosomal protein L14